MIEDIEGATSEPTRRRPVVLLSALTTFVSLILLAALVVLPPRAGIAPQAASPAPGASAGPVTTFVSNPISQLRIDLTHDSLCPDGTRLIPPYFLAVDGSTGDIFAVRSVVGTTRSVPVTIVADARTPWLSVTCATSVPPVVTGDMFGPWEFDER
jgi:hypothetical protein